ncbi:hypothetical protein [Archangium violaceum]|uniref:Uncharacterized protein n=1 Tax=Archangium violaceum Cb vi76 TaxID=1406225 RepID=A0A084STF5_9BACT|nr:hypothetical protein [Archangium violaceum]KFA91740.1 hypothetical protein Q664_20130 [Archangium violaceum Cb vi76]
MAATDSSDGSNNSNTNNNNVHKMTQMDAVAEGKLILPPDTSARVAKPKKTYPPGPPGKVLIFRWTRTDERTGQIIRAHGRPFPMWVDP